MTILVVDDAIFIREILKQGLLEAGFSEIVEAGDGIAAIEQFRNCNPEIVLLDLTMPHMNGLTTLRVMKKMNPQVKIIVCSAVSQREVVLKSLQHGAADYILKPFQICQVIETVNRVRNNQGAKGAALCF